MNELILSPSLLSADFSRLKDELSSLEASGLDWVHWDVMDGEFVPNITLGPPIINAARPVCSLFFDVHLMIQRPERYIQDFASAGADLICVHAEACTHLERVVSQIKEHGAQPALALNPATPLSAIDYLLPQLDLVLIMSVNPGFGGQRFIPFCLDKIRQLRTRLDQLDLACRLQVDGGVTLDNVQSIVAAGADTLVSGSAFFRHQDYQQGLEAFGRQASKGRSKTRG